MKQKLQKKPIELTGSHGTITIRRDQEGITRIVANHEMDLFFAQGWVHAHDRLLQMLLGRFVCRGELSQHLGDKKGLLDLDKMMRRVNLRDDARDQISRLDPETHSLAQAYADGINSYLTYNRLPWDLRLLGIKAPEWKIEDTLMALKLMGYLGLSQIQADLEKWLGQLLKHGFSPLKLKELFPALTDRIDPRDFQKITFDPPLVPEAQNFLSQFFSFTASNSWAVSPRRSQSGKAMLGNDPHLDISRLPAIWYEIILEYEDQFFAGASVPGIPGIVLGRSNYLAWGTTYSYMDSIDYFIEKCNGGRYLEEKEWLDFQVRVEEIQIKGRAPLPFTVYENPRGFLEGDPAQEGFYLTHSWSGRHSGAHELTGLFRLLKSRSVREAMDLFSKMTFAAFSWTLADHKGNIGMQMSGRIPRRAKGYSGLAPIPAWKRKNHWQGVESGSKNPRIFNPKEGIIITANNNLNQFGGAAASSVHMGPYRADRIMQLLSLPDKVTVDTMQQAQMDVYSLQAERLMKVIRPLLPDTENGKILAQWDLRYEETSLGATLFESVYHHLIQFAFGSLENLGQAHLAYLREKTLLFASFFHFFDELLLKKKTTWIQNREQLFQQAIATGLEIEPKPYGMIHLFSFKHLLFGKDLPKPIRDLFNFGPLPLRGNRATIHQGQIFQTFTIEVPFAPSFRMVVDFHEEGIHTALPGGASDRPFSRWYKNRIQKWYQGRFSYLEPQ